MKLLLLLLFLITISLVSSAQLTEIPKQEITKDYGFVVKTGQPVPEFELKLTNGTIINIRDLKGKVVMLQFTASWCGVCRDEMPHIESDIWLKHKNNPDFALFGIDMDEPLDKVKKFIDDMKITYPLALDPGAKIFYTFAAKGAGVTRNIIIGKDGNIVYLTRLFKQDEFDEMVEVIGFLLEK